MRIEVNILDFSKIINENFSAILATISSLTGVLLGFISTWYTQKKSFDRQMKWEQEKNERDKLEKLVSIYNKVLEIDGIKEVVDYNQGRFAEIQTDVYMNEVRKILFEKFHLLHPDIAKSVQVIDYEIKKWSVLEDAEDEEINYVTKEYLDMIKKIKDYVESLRIK